ncbi:MAG: GntR family transcriptional regulator [Clostridiales bacterium]|nr:GntR family transcriptional regulator [Clostridiales bacterium]
MQWKLDNNTPLYLQIADKVKLGIVSGEYMPGKRIDSVRDMAEQTGVNPNTMQRALSKLEEEGLLSTNRTSGKYVTEDTTLIKRIRDELAKKYVENFLASMKQMGFSGDIILALVQYEVGKGGDASAYNGM